MPSSVAFPVTHNVIVDQDDESEAQQVVLKVFPPFWSKLSSPPVIKPMFMSLQIIVVSLI